MAAGLNKPLRDSTKPVQEERSCKREHRRKCRAEGICCRRRYHQLATTVVDNKKPSAALLQRNN